MMPVSTLAPVSVEQKQTLIDNLVKAPNSKELAGVLTEGLFQVDPSDINLDDLQLLVETTSDKLLARAQEAFPEQKKLAEQILESFKFENGIIHLVIPSGFNDMFAMKALNAYFRYKYSEFVSSQIWDDERWLDLYSNQPGVINRDVMQERQINVIPLVDGSTLHNRVGQEVVLAKLGMTFAQPEELQLAILAYACHYCHVDLFIPRGEISTFSVRVAENGNSYPENGILALIGEGSRILGRSHKEYKEDSNKFLGAAAAISLSA